MAVQDVLDVDQACEYLGVSKQGLYKHVRAGKIPAFKMGSRWKFYKGSLEEWLKSRVLEDTAARKTKRRV